MGSLLVPHPLWKALPAAAAAAVADIQPLLEPVLVPRVSGLGGACWSEVDGCQAAGLSLMAAKDQGWDGLNLESTDRCESGAALLLDLLPTMPDTGARPQGHHPFCLCLPLIIDSSFDALAPARCTTTWPVSSCSSPRRRTSCWPSASRSELRRFAAWAKKQSVGQEQAVAVESASQPVGVCGATPAWPKQLSCVVASIHPVQWCIAIKPPSAGTPTTGPASAPSCCPPRPSSSCSTARRTGWRATHLTTASR